MEAAKEYVSIKHWDVDDRPREKLMERGIGALTDAELMAILLGSGTAKLSAVDLGRNLIKEFGGLERLAQASVKELTKVKGIGPAKAIGIVAAFELARRKQLVSRDELIITRPEVAADYLTPKLADLRHEVFVVLFLNARNQVIAEETISSGGVKGTVVDTRMVFKSALTHLATALVVAHNHPSGSPEPSSHDLKLTTDLAAAGKLLDIKLMDHLIITSKKFYSFADNGLL